MTDRAKALPAEAVEAFDAVQNFLCGCFGLHISALARLSPEMAEHGAAIIAEKCGLTGLKNGQQWEHDRAEMWALSAENYMNQRDAAEAALAKALAKLATLEQALDDATDIMEDHRRALAEALEALRYLRNEVAGWHEEELAEVGGWTNTTCLKRRQAEAEAILAAHPPAQEGSCPK